jgi:hypothetical protein
MGEVATPYAEELKATMRGAVYYSQLGSLKWRLTHIYPTTMEAL